MPSLEKNLGNILMDSHTKQNTQNIINQGELSQRFDTQIHIIDDITNRMNMDHQNLKGSLETLQTQQEINFKIVCTELKQSETIVDNLVNIVEALVLQLTQNSAEQKIHNILTKLWQEKIEKTITQLQQPIKAKENSFTLSSPDLKELPPHMRSSPKIRRYPSSSHRTNCATSTEK